MARLGDTLKFLVDADGQGAIREFDKIGKAAKSRLGDAQTGSSRLTAAIDKIAQRSPMAQKALDRMGLSAADAAGAVSALGPAAVAAGGAAVLAFGVKSVNAFQEAALAAGKMSDATGLAVEDASRWQEVTSDLGLSSESLTTALNKMNREAAKGGLSKVGIDAQGANEQFLAVLEYLNGITDENKRAAEATRLLGRGWQELAPLVGKVDELRSRLKAVSAQKVITTEERKKAEEFRDAMDELRDRADDLALSIGQGLAPALSRLARGASDAVPALQKAADAAGVALGAQVADQWEAQGRPSVWDVLSGKADKYGSVAKTAVMDAAAEARYQAYLQGQATDELADKTKELEAREKRRAEVATDALKRIRDEQDRNRQSILDTIDAVDDNARSYLDYLDQVDQTKSTIDKYQDAVAEQADLEKSMPGLTKKATDATGRKEQAASELASITDQLNALDEEAERIRRAEVDGILSAEEADRQLEQVRRRKYDLTQRQSDAELVLRDASRQAEDAQDKLADAQERLSKLTEDMNGLMRDAQRAILDQASAAGEGAAKNATLQTETGKAAAAAIAQRDAYKALATEIGPGSALMGFLDGLIEKQKQAARQALILSALTFNDTYARDAYNAATNLSGSVAMASGGIVMPKAGGTLARIGEAGRPEAVIPLPTGTAGAGIGGAATVNIYMPPGSDGQDVVDAIERWRRRGGRARWMAA